MRAGWLLTFFACLSLGSTASAQHQVLEWPGASAKQVPQFSPEVLSAFEAIQAEAASRTPAQRKISSGLLYESRKRRGAPMVAPGLSALSKFRTGVKVDESGKVLVDIKADVSPEVLALISILGGQVESSYARYSAIRATIPPSQLEALAAHADVKSIRPASIGFTNK